ncbi:MAG: putative acetyltransferase [Methanocella sp. PtaU1.Bin125]|nr:MAG: putative acetyltransferase [Methanocella sp. PtaU1.Bin125]
MADVMYLELGADYLDMIRPLWEGLNEHHLVRSPNFRQHYEQMTFEVRKRDLLKKPQLRVILAAEEGRPIGYCVCTIDGETGEIDSIFVEEAYRRSGIGEELMRRAIAWLDAGNARKKIVAVAAGNEAAIPFYESFGFLPRMTVLQMSEERRPAD